MLKAYWSPDFFFVILTCVTKIYISYALYFYPMYPWENKNQTSQFCDIKKTTLKKIKCLLTMERNKSKIKPERIRKTKEILSKNFVIPRFESRKIETKTNMKFFWMCLFLVCLRRIFSILDLTGSGVRAWHHQNGAVRRGLQTVLVRRVLVAFRVSQILKRNKGMKFWVWTKMIWDVTWKTCL